MHKFLRSTRRGWMLFNDADQGGKSGSEAPAAPAKAPGEAAAEPTPAPNPAPAPAPAPEATPAEKTAATAKPSVFTRAAGMLKDKSELLGQMAAKDERIAQLTHQLGEMTTALQAETAKVSELAAGKSEIEAAFSQLEKKDKDVSSAAATQIAALGFDASRLPAAHNGDTTDADAPTSAQDFMKRHGEMSSEGKTEAAAKFYSKYAKKFGL